MGLTKIDQNERYRNLKETNKKKELYYSKDNKKNIFEDSITNEELIKFFEDSENKEEIIACGTTLIGKKLE